MSVLHGLLSCAGAWRGTNTLHDPNSGRPDESPSELTVTPVLGGKFIRLDYTWAHQGEPQEGSLLLGFDPKIGEVSGHWIDTWHMGRKIMACKGPTPIGGTISVEGSYSVPPGPDWGWRIEITPQDGQSIRVAHFNVDPDEKEEPAVEATYARA
ncbi:MAG: DUF1579 family protein [Isosphaeraceae bacterium]